MTSKISEKMAVNIWEDHVGDSGKAPTDEELTDFANAVINVVSPQIEVDAISEELYESVMELFLYESQFNISLLHIANNFKNIFGASRKKRVALDLSKYVE